MDYDVKVGTLVLMSVGVFSVLVMVAFVIDFPDETSRLFFIGLAAVLSSINVAGMIVIWRSSPTVVDEVFLMSPGGLLLKHYTRRLKPDQDDDILAGMLTAVQNFIKESFDEAGGRLNEIRFENYDILISHGKNVIVAAIISTKKPERLRNQLKTATDEIEKTFGERLVNWNGDKKALTGIDPIMKRFLSGRFKSNSK
jgi:OOP family OmpA-OmpF porin